jgi:hypothetical protein
VVLLNLANIFFIRDECLRIFLLSIFLVSIELVYE